MRTRWWNWPNRRQAVKDVGVVKLQVVEHRRGGGSAQTCCACRRRRCRIHRPQSQTAALRLRARAGHRALVCTQPGRCQFSGTPPIKKPGCNPALPESRSASTWWSSCRACPPPPAHGGLAAHAHHWGRWCRAGPHPEWLPISGNFGLSASRARLTTLPTTNISGCSAGWSAPKPSISSNAQGAQLVAHGRVHTRHRARDFGPASRARAASHP